VKNVTTGAMTGADPTRRHVVRLTGSARHKKGDQRVRLVSWDVEDALPFPLRVAVRQQGDLITDISVARGNIILADHGQTFRHELLPPPWSQQRYRPYLGNPGLASAVPYHHEKAVKLSAHRTIQQDARAALPLIALFQQSRSLPLKVDAELEFPQHIFTLSDH